MEMFLFIFSSFILFLLNCFSGTTAKVTTIKLCVIYEKTVPTRETQIKLSSIIVNNLNELNSENRQKNIKNGECFDVKLAHNEEMSFVKFFFDIYVYPTKKDDKQKLKHSKNLKTDVEEPITNIGTIMHRSVIIHLTTWVDDGQQLVVNLGKIDPPGLFLNRRLFVEPKNDNGTYYAYLYAKENKTTENGNGEEKKIFVGYAPLIRANGEASTSQQKQQTNLVEYHLSIPIEENHLFHPKICDLYLKIFHYEKGNENKKEFPIENTSNTENELDKNCAICLGPLDDGETMKLHQIPNKNVQHLFHKHCLAKWIETRQQIRCPLCNWELKLPMDTHNIHAIFDGPAQFCSTFSLNSMADLFALANGQLQSDEFKRKQAQNIVKMAKQILNSFGETLLQLLYVANFLPQNESSIDDLFDIGAEGIEEKSKLRQIQSEIDTILNNDVTTAGGVKTMLSILISETVAKIKSKLNKFAKVSMENLQRISAGF